MGNTEPSLLSVFRLFTGLRLAFGIVSAVLSKLGVARSRRSNRSPGRRLNKDYDPPSAVNEASSA